MLILWGVLTCFLADYAYACAYALVKTSLKTWKHCLIFPYTDPTA